MKVLWTKEATDKLIEIKADIGRLSKRHVTNLFRRIIKRGNQLANNPRLGWVVPEYGIETVREIFEHPYRIIYQIFDRHIAIVDVYHVARQLPRGHP